MSAVDASAASCCPRRGRPDHDTEHIARATVDVALVGVNAEAAHAAELRIEQPLNRAVKRSKPAPDAAEEALELVRCADD